MTILTQQTTTRTTPAGMHQTIVYDVFIDPYKLATLARRAAGNKNHTSNDGPLIVVATAITEEPR